jgi:hypothetical protein
MERCPFLVDVTADWLWLYPRGVFCADGRGKIRVPAGQTIVARCTGASYRECEGYLAATTAKVSSGKGDTV